jgi:aminoglycoside/choline kinase family phosphotransferase
MARNLLPDGRGGVALLDFQDLRLGPPAYDLASLLNDSLYAEPELEARIVGARLERVGGWEGYRRAVAQRCLKAVGTFARFASTGRTRHLRLVPPTLERALRQLVQLPETSAAVAPLVPALVAAGEAASRVLG